MTRPNRLRLIALVLAVAALWLMTTDRGESLRLDRGAGMTTVSVASGR